LDPKYTIGDFISVFSSLIAREPVLFKFSVGSRD
jgi:hypothetical protein